jgi:DNA-directed RNA polymerase specialized sigma24 family protein
MHNSALETHITELWEAQHDTLAIYLADKIGHGENVHELVIQTFAKYFISQVGDTILIQNPKAYLWKIAENLLIDHYKYQALTKYKPLEDAINTDKDSTEIKIRKYHNPQDEIIACIKKNISAEEWESLNQNGLKNEKSNQIKNRNSDTISINQNLLTRFKNLIKKVFKLS